MAWQAVNGMGYSQAGVGGPQGVRSRAGSAGPGFAALVDLTFGITIPQPTGTPAQLAAVRHALAVWGITTVVVAPQPSDRVLTQGHDPTYAAGFMTAVLGRLPTIEAGAWVWNNVLVGDGPVTPSALRLGPGALANCVTRDERRVGPTTATLDVAHCVTAAAKS